MGMDSRRWPASKASLFLSFGFEGSRRNNLCYIAPNILIHACGNVVHFLDIQALSQTFLPSVEGGGIGAVAVHPSKDYFAVCEKGWHPSVYIYNFPSLEQAKVLKKGTEILYTAAAFSHNGQQLATVGGHPDYWLTVWDWSNETIILQSKAFSQEIFNVSFSKYFSGQLITTGIGHIRFWQMATTFTGLKLEVIVYKGHSYQPKLHWLLVTSEDYDLCFSEKSQQHWIFSPGEDKLLTNLDLNCYKETLLFGHNVFLQPLFVEAPFCSKS